MVLDFAGPTNLFKTSPEDGDVFGQEGNRKVPLSDPDAVTKVLAIPGVSFIRLDTTKNGTYDGTGAIINADDIEFIAPVQLPHNATVTSFKCVGTATLSETVELTQVDHDGGNPIVMSQVIIGGSTDSTITSPKINNSLYKYIIVTAEITGTGDKVQAAVIEYK